MNVIEIVNGQGDLDDSRAKIYNKSTIKHHARS